MEWYKVELSAEQMANGVTLELQNEFDKIWIDNKCPSGFALFFLKEPSVPSIIYISPLASNISKTLILKYNGQPCDSPLRADVGFVVGDNKALA